jgi:hypothetical protein
LRIRISDDWDGPFTLRVYTATGQLLREYPFSSRSFTLDGTAFPAGTFLLEVTNGEQQQIKRVVLH